MLKEAFRVAREIVVIFHVKMKLTMEMNSHMGFVNIEAAVQKIVL